MGEAAAHLHAITNQTNPATIQSRARHRVALAVDVNRVRVDDAAAALEELDVFFLIGFDGLFFLMVYSESVCANSCCTQQCCPSIPPANRKHTKLPPPTASQNQIQNHNFSRNNHESNGHGAKS